MLLLLLLLLLPLLLMLLLLLLLLLLLVQLERKMLRAVGDAERRERAVSRLEGDLQRASEQRMAEVEVLARRGREEAQHQQQLLKSAAVAGEQEVKRLRHALRLSEDRASKVDEEFAAFRAKVSAIQCAM